MDLDGASFYLGGIAHYLAGETDQKIENEEISIDFLHFHFGVSSESNLGKYAGTSPGRVCWHNSFKSCICK